MLEISRQINAQVVSIKPWLKDRALRAQKKEAWEEAVGMWRRLLRLCQPESVDAAEAHYHLGMLNDRMGEMTKSIFHLGCAVRLQPASARYHQGFGRAFLNLHHFRLAKSHFEEALKLEPKRDAHWRHYSWALFQSGEVDRAIHAAERALKIKPESERCLWLLVHLLTERKRWKEASKVLHRWRERASSSKQFQACLLWSQKKYALSLQGAVHHHLRKRISCDGKPFNLGHLREAERIWVRFCQAHPDFSQRRANLRLIRIWAGAAVIVSSAILIDGEDSLSLLLASFAKRFDVKNYELEAAIRILKTPDLGKSLSDYDKSPLESHPLEN